jgi:hypothetical protein
MGRESCCYVCYQTAATGCKFTAPPMTHSYIAGNSLVQITTLLSFSHSSSAEIHLYRSLLCFHYLSLSLLFVVYGLWFMVYGLWFMVYGLWFMVYGSWFMFYGLWFMVYGLWSTVCGLRFMVCGAWFFIYLLFFRSKEVPLL